MSEIKWINVDIAYYLFEAECDKWSHAHFDRRRYSIMTTNIVEYLNGVLKEARMLLVHKLLDNIINLLRDWFCKRHHLIVDTTTKRIK